MNYLCQTCKSNNNGWCIVRKCNGLKKLNIMSCNTYEDKNKCCDEVKIVDVIKTQPIARGKRAEISVYDDYDAGFKDNSEAYRVLGKRQMLWNIQSQIAAINESDESYEEKYKGLVDCVKSFGIHLNFEEDLWKVSNVIDSMIDEAMIKESKYINDNLL